MAEETVTITFRLGPADEMRAGISKDLLDKYIHLCGDGGTIQKMNWIGEGGEYELLRTNIEVLKYERGGDTYDYFFVDPNKT